jgi:hypothetical protein
MLTFLSPEVNAGFTLVECNREIYERRAKHEQQC